MLRTRHRRASSAAERAVKREKQNGSKGSQRLEDDAPGDEKGGEKEALEAGNREHMPPAAADVVSLGELDMDDVTSGMSALKFVPPSVRFGRGGRRGGFSRS